MKLNKEFMRGYRDSFSHRHRPWHITTKQFAPESVAYDYLQGYAHGYARVRQQEEKRTVNAYLFSLGYQHAIRNHTPMLKQASYIEGFALGREDKEQPNTSLDAFFDVQMSRMVAIRSQLGTTLDDL